MRVLTRTKQRAHRVEKQFNNDGITAAAIHGNKSQAARQRALEGFKANRVRVLVATDIAARGIDVDGVTHVIIFDLPNEPESYVHRIGRTGRAGTEGIALSFCDPAERHHLRGIERLIKRSIDVFEHDRSVGKKIHGSPEAPNEKPVQRTNPKRPAGQNGKRKKNRKRRQKRNRNQNSSEAA